MNQQEADKKTEELIALLKPKYNDVSAHIDLVPGTDEINISIFWNRKSRDMYREAKSYRCKANDYETILNEEISKLL